MAKEQDSEEPEILCTLEETDDDGRRIKQTMPMRHFFEEMCRAGNTIRLASYDPRTGRFEDETYSHQEDEGDFGIITADGAEYDYNDKEEADE